MISAIFVYELAAGRHPVLWLSVPHFSIPWKRMKKERKCDTLRLKNLILRWQKCIKVSDGRAKLWANLQRTILVDPLSHRIKHSQSRLLQL